MQLKDATIVNEVRNIINIYMHDHQTGMPRGQTGPMLCMAAAGTVQQTDGQAAANSKTQEPDRNNNNIQIANSDGGHSSGDVNAATKGNGKGKKGAKGYGECWHCGEWGHPRRECSHLNEPANDRGSIDALNNGKGKGGKGKGKNGKGKGKGWKGKWGKGYNYNVGYRSPGKGVGKGRNELSDDWFNVWGSNGWGDHEGEYDYNEDYWYGYGGELGNVAMMLERKERKDTEEKEITKTTGEHDPLRNTRRARLTTIYNSFSILTNDDDSDDDDSDVSDTTTRHSMTKHDNSCDKRHKPNKRQRLKRKQKIDTLKDVKLSEACESDMKQQCECTNDHGQQLHEWNGDNVAREGHDNTMPQFVQCCLDVGNVAPHQDAGNGVSEWHAVSDASGAVMACSGGHKQWEGPRDGKGLLAYNRGAWAPARLGRGSQRQREGPLTRMMRRHGPCNCTHTHDHNQHDHDDTHNHSQNVDGDEANRNAAASITSTNSQRLQYDNHYTYYPYVDADALLLNDGAPKPTLSVLIGNDLLSQALTYCSA